MLPALLAATLALGPADATPELKPDLRVMVRPEGRVGQPTAPGADSPDASWAVRQTARVGLTGRWQALTAKVQVQDVRNWGATGVSNSTGGFFALHQGYLEVGGKQGRVEGYLRAGRQQISLWTERVFGWRPWSVANQAFDSARGYIEVDKWHAQAAGLMIRVPDDLEVGDPAMPATVRTYGQHIGFAETGFAFHRALHFDVATILAGSGPTQADPTQDKLFVMPGFHLSGKPGRGFHYEVEAWLQAGRDTERRHVAWGGVVLADYTFRAVSKPTVGVTYELASGEACTGDPSAGEPCGSTRSADFDPLFGVRHRFRGRADMVGWSNLRNLEVFARITPDEFATFRVDYLWLQLHDARGTWHDLSLQPVGQGWDPDGTQHTLGHEVDVTVELFPWGFLRVVPGYSIFVPVAAGRRLGGSDPVHFTYLWLTAEF